jgi:creatinine amidohydrolase
LSIGQAAVELLVLELGRSAAETFAHVLFVSAHGGNASPVTRAVARLRSESRDVALFAPHRDGDAHAGHEETAMLLSLRPTVVHPERGVPGDRRPLPELMPLLRSGGVRAVTETGILGDPTGATAAAGAQLLDGLSTALAAMVANWRAA